MGGYGEVGMKSEQFCITQFCITAFTMEGTLNQVDKVTWPVDISLLL